MGYTAGAVIEVGYPFVWERSGAPDAGEYDMNWRPGTRDRQTAPDDFDMVADGMGTMVLTVVSVHKPGRYPERVFYERSWRDPDGREFGRQGRLFCRSTAQFTAMTKGYRHRFYILDRAVKAA